MFLNGFACHHSKQRWLTAVVILGLVVVPLQLQGPSFSQLLMPHSSFRDPHLEVWIKEYRHLLEDDGRLLKEDARFRPLLRKIRSSIPSSFHYGPFGTDLMMATIDDPKYGDRVNAYTILFAVAYYLQFKWMFAQGPLTDGRRAWIRTKRPLPQAVWDQVDRLLALYNEHAQPRPEVQPALDFQGESMVQPLNRWVLLAECHMRFFEAYDSAKLFVLLAGENYEILPGEDRLWLLADGLHAFASHFASQFAKGQGFELDVADIAPIRHLIDQGIQELNRMDHDEVHNEIRDALVLGLIKLIMILNYEFHFWEDSDQAVDQYPFLNNLRLSDSDPESSRAHIAHIKTLVGKDPVQNAIIHRWYSEVLREVSALDVKTMAPDHVFRRDPFGVGFSWEFGSAIYPEFQFVPVQSKVYGIHPRMMFLMRRDSNVNAYLDQKLKKRGAPNYAVTSSEQTKIWGYDAALAQRVIYFFERMFDFSNAATSDVASSADVSI